MQGRDANKVAIFRIANCIVPSQQLADRLTNWWAERCAPELTILNLTTNIAAELTSCSSADKNFPAIDSVKLKMRNFWTESELKRHCLFPVKKDGRTEFEQSSLSITCSRGLWKSGWRIGNAAVGRFFVELTEHRHQPMHSWDVHFGMHLHLILDKAWQATPLVPSGSFECFCFNCLGKSSSNTTHFVIG